MTRLYHVVTSNGAGKHNRHGFKSFRKAREAASEIAASWAGHGLIFEIEREDKIEVGEGPNAWTYGSRYFMRRGSRWVLWDSGQGPDVRHPDFMVAP